jgi:hypothetical protein
VEEIAKRGGARPVLLNKYHPIDQIGIIIWAGHAAGIGKRRSKERKRDHTLLKPKNTHFLLIIQYNCIVQ